MSDCLESYGEAIFVLVLIVILVAFVSPLGKMIKDATTKQVSKTEKIGKDEITVAMGGVVEPDEAVDKVYCIYYNDGEMTISQNEIKPEAGRTVVNKGFSFRPSICSNKMTTVRFVGAVKPKDCSQWFYNCYNLIQIKNMKNLYTSECINMCSMFDGCNTLTNVDFSRFNTDNVKNMDNMFKNCSNLVSINVSKWNVCKVESMFEMFGYCHSLINLDLSEWNTSRVTNMHWMFNFCDKLTNLDLSNKFNITSCNSTYNIFNNCTSLKVKSIKVSQITYNKLIEFTSSTDIGTTIDKFLIIDK